MIAVLIAKEREPRFQKAPRRLQLLADGAGQQLRQRGLLIRRQMVGMAQQESAMASQALSDLAHLGPIPPACRWLFGGRLRHGREDVFFDLASGRMVFTIQACLLVTSS